MLAGHVLLLLEGSLVVCLITRPSETGLVPSARPRSTRTPNRSKKLDVSTLWPIRAGRLKPKGSTPPAPPKTTAEAVVYPSGVYVLVGREALRVAGEVFG